MYVPTFFSSFGKKKNCKTYPEDVRPKNATFSCRLDTTSLIECTCDL